MIATSSSDSSPAISTSALPQVPVTLDSTGRMRTSLEQRRVILAEFERSGVSAVQFARRAGLKYSTLAGWVARERKSKGPGRAQPVRLLEALVDQGPGRQSSALTLLLPGGARVEMDNVHQAALAAELVRSLAKPC